MKAPFWKNMLSYFYEFHIESTHSDHNPQLHVSLSRGQYQLCTEKAVYSYGSLYDNFATTFAKIDIDNRAIQNVLILGFGLASIPYILEKTFHKKYHYTGVEIDEEVIYLANKYVLDEINSGVEVICADAELFVEQCQQQFDLICVDLFLDDLIPSQFEQIEFLRNIDKLLQPDGIILYNRLATTSMDIVGNHLFLETVFKKQFPEAGYLKVGENWIILNQADLLKNGGTK